MNIQYFSDTDTLYIALTHRDVAETLDINENTLIDLDFDGNLVAITLEHARELVDIFDFSFKQVANSSQKQPA